MCIMCYEPLVEKTAAHSRSIEDFFGTSLFPSIDFEPSKIKDLAIHQLQHKMALTGVQKKLSTSLISDKQKGSHIIRLTIRDALDGLYIFKPQTEQYPFMPEIEDLTMHLAQICQFKVAKHSLIPFDNGDAYLTKRFDRHLGHKIPIEDLCQLSQKMSSDTYRSSMEKVGKVIALYATYPGEELKKLFEITCSILSLAMLTCI